MKVHNSLYYLAKLPFKISDFASVMRHAGDSLYHISKVMSTIKGGHWEQYYQDDDDEDYDDYDEEEVQPISGKELRKTEKIRINFGSGAQTQTNPDVTHGSTADEAHSGESEHLAHDYNPEENERERNDGYGVNEGLAGTTGNDDNGGIEVNDDGNRNDGIAGNDGNTGDNGNTGNDGNIPNQHDGDHQNSWEGDRDKREERDDGKEGEERMQM
jgi:hypothetical protein